MSPQWQPPLTPTRVLSAWSYQMSSNSKVLLEWRGKWPYLNPNSDHKSPFQLVIFKVLQFLKPIYIKHLGCIRLFSTIVWVTHKKHSCTFYLTIDGTVLQILYSVNDSQPHQLFTENLRNRWWDYLFHLFSKLYLRVGPDPAINNMQVDHCAVVSSVKFLKYYTAETIRFVKCFWSCIVTLR